jgi:hypothetical protein
LINLVKFPIHSGNIIISLLLQLKLVNLVRFFIDYGNIFTQKYYLYVIINIINLKIYVGNIFFYKLKIDLFFYLNYREILYKNKAYKYYRY